MPEALWLLILIAMMATWETHERTLGGWGFPVLGPAAQGILWAGLYTALGLAYGAVALSERKPLRSVLSRLALGLGLALLATHLCRLFVELRVAPAAWSDLFYLRRLLPPLFVGLWCAALLPRETLVLVRAARSSPTIAPLPQLAVLCASAAILVSCGDFAFSWAEGSAIEAKLKSEVILRSAWTTNAVLLLSAYAVVFAVSGRLSTALLLVSPLYAAWGAACLVKIEYMHATIQPLDLVRIPEFLPLIRSFFGTGALVVAVGTLAAWIAALVAAHRSQTSPVPRARRWFVGLLSFAVLLAVPAAFFLAYSLPFHGPSPQRREAAGAAKSLVLRLGAPGRPYKERARTQGFLLSFLSELPMALIAVPPNYSAGTVARVLARYQQQPPAAPSTGRPGVSLIIYLVESFMDPDELGFHYRYDPIPNFRALWRAGAGGYGIVPEQFGGSINTEFEALTGMTRSFLPEGSLTYRQQLRQPIPSLPRALKDLGYVTVAIQADPKYWFNRERAYDLLGFDRVEWLFSAPGVERAASGRGPSDRAVVDEIIEASRRARPFFAFAFPSSTHSPYHLGRYRSSDLDVLDPPAGDAAGEVKEYVNMLRVADAAIGSLIQHFRQQPDSTIIVIFGDHLPPLSEQALHPFFGKLSALSRIERTRMLHRVPLVVWANFDLSPEETEQSINGLPAYLLGKMGISPPGFLAVTDVVRRRLPVLGDYVEAADGRRWDRDSLPPEAEAMLEDYRLLQYDLLLGKQYSLRVGASGWEGQVGPATRPSAPAFPKPPNSR